MKILDEEVAKVCLDYSLVSKEFDEKKLELREVSKIVLDLLSSKSTKLLLLVSRAVEDRYWLSVGGIFNENLKLADEDYQKLIVGSEKDFLAKIEERENPVWLGDRTGSYFDDDFVY